MRKLTLDPDAVRVQSFHTGVAEGRGTVRGCFADTDTGEAVRVSDPWTCANDPESCGGTCDPDCPCIPPES